MVQSHIGTDSVVLEETFQKSCLGLFKPLIGTLPHLSSTTWTKEDSMVLRKVFVAVSFTLNYTHGAPRLLAEKPEPEKNIRL